VKFATTRRRIISALGLGLVAAILTGCQAFSTLPPATEQAVMIADLYNLVFVIAAVVFVLVEGLIIWSVIRYRRKPSDHSLPTQTHGNFALEIVWTAIPLIIVVALFFASADVLKVVDAREEDKAEVKIEVVGYQWQWKFGYPDAGIQIFGTAAQEPQLVIPIGKTIQISLIGQDVNHGFYIPEFLFQRDAVPGQVNVFQFTPNKLGTFSGQCSAFCGLLHTTMRFSVKVVTAAEYDAWIAENKPKPAAAATGPIAGTVEEWKITISAAEHVAGSVTFNLANQGSIPHEFIVVRSDKSATELLELVDPATNRLDEAILDVVGEQPEFDPGSPGSVTLDLPPGRYILMCNIEGHYKAGMYTELEIVPGSSGSTGRRVGV